MHQRAAPAAEAAQCAHEQGKFWEYHDKIMANQQKLSDDDLKQFATDISLDVEKFNACYTSGKFRADVQKDQTDGQKVGVSGTPAFLINGRFLSGAQPFESFKAIIDEELKN
jgi:protein-disulfide isomerase